MGRFLTADPSRASAGAEHPGGWNRYAYSAADPLNFYDPEGLFISSASIEITRKKLAPEATAGYCYYGGVQYPAWHLICKVMPTITEWAPYPQTADDVEGFASSVVLDRQRQLHRSVFEAVQAAIGVVASNSACAALFKGLDPIIALTSMVGKLNSSGLLETSSFEFFHYS